MVWQTFLGWLCGIIRLMCQAAEEWNLCFFNWQLRNLSTIDVAGQGYLAASRESRWSSDCVFV